MGIIKDVKQTYGYIDCVEREEELFFHIDDFESGLDPKNCTPGLEVEFMVVTDPRTRKKKAAKILLLPKGTVQFDVTIAFPFYSQPAGHRGGWCGRYCETGMQTTWSQSNARRRFEEVKNFFALLTLKS